MRVVAQGTCVGFYVFALLFNCSGFYVLMMAPWEERGHAGLGAPRSLGQRMGVPPQIIVLKSSPAYTEQP